MSCQLLACPPLPHAIYSKPAATLTGLSYVVPCKLTPAKFTGPSEVLIITQSHLSCVVLTPVCHVVRNKVREQTEPVRTRYLNVILSRVESRDPRAASLSTGIARIDEYLNNLAALEMSKLS
jgi:hypothetical protein